MTTVAVALPQSTTCRGRRRRPSERRFRRVLGAALGLFIGFGIIDSAAARAAPPPRSCRRPCRSASSSSSSSSRAAPKPEPKVEVPQPQPEACRRSSARVESRRRSPQATPRPDPRKKAAASGLLALSDQLAELRDLDVDRNASDSR